MKTLQSQLEQVAPIILIRELVSRATELNTNEYEYSTQWLDWGNKERKPLVPLPMSKQLGLLHALRKKDVIGTEDLIRLNNGTVEVKDESIPSQGGRLINVVLHDGLEKTYRDMSGDLYSPFVGSGEMAFRKQVDWMKKYLKQKTAKANRCQVTVEDRDIPPNVNPHLCILYLEAIGFLDNIVSLKSDHQIIAEVTVNGNKRAIGTNRFLYDLETAILSYSTEEETHHSTTGQIGRVIIAMSEENHALSDKEIRAISTSKSGKTLQSFTSELLNKINKEYPIIRRVKGSWEFIE